LWHGVVTASKEHKYLGFAYGGAAIISIYFARGGFLAFMLILMVGTAIGFGSYIKIREANKARPMKEKIAFYNRVFTCMNFRASDTSIPDFLYETEVSDHTTIVSFDALIPVNKWLERKEELEMYFDAKISDIRQDEEDNRVIDIYVQTKPLPEYLEWSDEFVAENNVLNIGVSDTGVVGMNLEAYPHAFIAGETGSGKSNILKCLIYQALVKEYDVILIDFKRGVSFSAFGDDVSIHYDYPDVIQVLKDMVAETTSRLDKFRSRRVDNIADYNRVAGDYLHRKIIFIDELAELLKTRDKETANILNDSIETLTRLSRAVGIHLIMGIQRPDSTIISGQIKNNVSYRVCGRFVDREPSRIMLSCDMASGLPNVKGRFIVKDDDLCEVQSFYFTNKSVMLPLEQGHLDVVDEEIYSEPDVEAMSGMGDDVMQNLPKEKPTDSAPFEFDFSEFRK